MSARKRLAVLWDYLSPAALWLATDALMYRQSASDPFAPPASGFTAASATILSGLGVGVTLLAGAMYARLVDKAVDALIAENDALARGAKIAVSLVSIAPGAYVLAQNLATALSDPSQASATYATAAALAMLSVAATSLASAVLRPARRHFRALNEALKSNAEITDAKQPVAYGQYVFADAAAYETYVSAQRDGFSQFRNLVGLNIPDEEVLKRQRDCIVAFKSQGELPALTWPEPHLTLEQLLTPNVDARGRPVIVHKGFRSYHTFGNLHVETRLVDRFIRAHRYLANLEETMARTLLTGLRAGGPPGRQKAVFLRENKRQQNAFVTGRYELSSAHLGGTRLVFMSQSPTVLWDPRVMIRYNEGATTFSPAEILAHEEEHALFELYFPVEQYVLHHTPDPRFGTQSERRNANGAERVFGDARGIPPRDTHVEGEHLAAQDVDSPRVGIHVAINGGTYHFSEEHRAEGTLVQLLAREVVLRCGSDRVTYRLSELSFVLARGDERATRRMLAGAIGKHVVIDLSAGKSVSETARPFAQDAQRHRAPSASRPTRHRPPS